MAELDYGKFQSPTTPITTQQKEEIELQGLPEVPRDEPLSYEKGGTNPAEEEDNSFLSKTLNLMDNLVPDDMGGAVRGESGWLEDTFIGSAYEQTVGRVLGAGLSGGESVFNGIEWFSSQVSMLSAAAVSAMPGGVQTLTWDEAHEVSFGQALVGSMAIEAGKLERGEGDLATAALLPFSLIALGLAQIDTDNSAQDKGFDVKNLQDRKAAFESEGAGQFFSGFSDAAIMIATDPTIALGGAGTFIRTGAKGGKAAATAGLTTKRIQTQKQVALHSTQIDEAAAMINGAPGATAAERIAAARNTKGWSAEGEAFVYAMEGDGLALQTSVYVTGSNKANQKKIVDILKETSIEDPNLSAATLKVLTGDVSAWGDVRAIDIDLYDRLASINNIDSVKGVRNADGTYPPQTPEGIAAGDDIIADAQGYKDFVSDPEIQEAFDPIALNLVTEGGNHMSAKAAYLANAWRKGKATSSLGTKGSNGARSSYVNGRGATGWVAEALERTSSSRAINVVRWGGKGTPPGFVMLKGLDGERGNKQVGNWLRGSSLDQKASTRLFNEFVDAPTEGEKALVLAKMEVEDLVKQAAKHGIGEATAKSIAARYAASRGKELANARKTKELYAVDELGNQTVLPEFLRETNSAVPMMDSKQMGHVLRQNSEALKSWSIKNLDPRGREVPVLGAKTTDILDEINSAWKVSVLLRLGYTQRNLGEGALRALATQGYLAVNGKAMMNLPRNTFHRTEEISYSLAARRAKKQLIRTQKVLDNNIAELKAMGGRTKVARDAKNAQRGVVQDLMDETLAIKEKIDGHLTNAVQSRGKRNLLGEQRSKFQKENDLQATFEGPDGDLYRDLSSAEATTRRTIDAGANREIQNVTGGHDFVPMDPSKLSAVDMGGYWDEFVLRINDKYMSDAFAKRVLATNPDGTPKFTRQDHIDWINSNEGNSYYRELKGGNYSNETDQATRMGYVDSVIKRLDNELPVGAPRAMYAKHSVSGTKPTSLQVEKAFAGRDLPTIPGRLVDLDGQSLSGGVWKKYKEATSLFMRGLGTVPETKLLRHPFYNNAYKQRQKQLFSLNVEQGVEMTSSVKASINKAAHSSALAQTNDVMYTILEMSNFAESLRFISPFFASFENSLKTWSKIAYANPALIGVSDKVFNIPNNLGLVFDDEGNQVEHSSIFKDNDTFVILPDAVQDFLTDNDIGSGEKMKFRQQGMNFVFPGEQAWWPGLGPMSTVPSALLLRGKPETTEIIKNAMGEGFFREFVPMGDPNTNLVEYMMPTWARKLKQMVSGNEDGAYASLKAQMMTDAYIKAQINDTTITDKDLKRVEEEANKFWTFQVGAALTAPWQSQRESPYALQRQGWRKLIENDDIPYDQKVLKFIDKYGTDFLAITRGRTNNVTGLDANTQVFSNVKGNSELLKTLESVNPKLVGMLANIGSDEAPYSQAVSQEFNRYTINGNKVKENLSSVEVLEKNEIGDGWKLWTEANDIIDGRLRELGLSSVNVNGAEGLKAIREGERSRLAALYPAWGRAQESFESNLGDYIYGLRAMVDNDKFNELQPKAARAIGLYLNIREAAGSAIRATDSNEEKEAIRQQAYSGIIQLRDSNIAFADLFDQFLDRDDFREVSQSGTR